MAARRRSTARGHRRRRNSTMGTSDPKRLMNQKKRRSLDKAERDDNEGES